MSFAFGSGKLKSEDVPFYIITIVVVFAVFLLASFGVSAFIYFQTGGGAHPLPNWISFALQLTPFLFGLTALLVSAKVFLGRDYLSLMTSRKSIDFKRFFFAAGLWLLISMVFLFMAKGAGAPIIFRWNPETQIPLLIVCLILLPIQTAFEDVLYRGFLFQGIARYTGKAWLALIVLALLFGWMHSGNPEVKRFGDWVLPFYMLSGLFLGVLTHLDDGLELGMGYHFANNLFGGLIITNSWQVFQTDAFFLDASEPYFGWENYMSILILQPLLLFVFYKVYRWKHPIKKMMQ